MKLSQLPKISSIKPRPPWVVLVAPTPEPASAAASQPATRLLHTTAGRLAHTEGEFRLALDELHSNSQLTDTYGPPNGGPRLRLLVPVAAASGPTAAPARLKAWRMYAANAYQNRTEACLPLGL